MTRRDDLKAARGIVLALEIAALFWAGVALAAGWAWLRWHGAAP